MSKVKLFLTMISILIVVIPITVQVIIYRDNPVDLILPPTFAALLNGGTDDLSTVDVVDFAGMSFSLPFLSEEPVFFQNNTIKLIYTFTNPLDGKITITTMDAKMVCTDHKFKLGDTFIEPATLEPKQTINFNVYCILSTTAIEHIATHHQGQDSINTEFENFSVDLTDIKIIMPHRKLGSIQIPQTILKHQTLI
ncbi:MAG: hypothetical protein LBC12_05940 [Nitrososphaerota archaeon]|jgi:hypothetical protein|nr:hypothetical protein [Nitrososphaerota archaeon]